MDEATGALTFSGGGDAAPTADPLTLFGTLDSGVIDPSTDDVIAWGGSVEGPPKLVGFGRTGTVLGLTPGLRIHKIVEAKGVEGLRRVWQVAGDGAVVAYLLDDEDHVSSTAPVQTTGPGVAGPGVAVPAFEATEWFENGLRHGDSLVKEGGVDVLHEDWAGGQLKTSWRSFPGHADEAGVTIAEKYDAQGRRHGSPDAVTIVVSGPELERTYQEHWDSGYFVERKRAGERRTIEATV